MEFQSGRVALLLALVLSSGCSGDDASHTTQDQPRPQNVLLISLDTLRADHLGCYGYERPTTPQIDALAARGVLFENAISTASWTVPSHMSMLTGLYPRTHGVGSWLKSLPDDVVTLAQVLSKEGVHTAAHVNTRLLGQNKGFARGFDSYKILNSKKNDPGAAPQIVDETITWLGERGAELFFLFLHIYDAHGDYLANAECTEEFVRPYTGPCTGKTPQLRAYRRGEIDVTWDQEDAQHMIDLYDGCALRAHGRGHSQKNSNPMRLNALRRIRERGEE